MPTTVMSLKTDKNVKEKAQKLAKKMGFPLGTLINGFLRQFIRDESVHFSMEPTIPMSKNLEKILDEVGKDIKNRKNISPVFDDPEDAIKYLHEHKN